MMVHMCSHRSDSLTCQGLYNDKQKQTQQQKYTTKKKKKKRNTKFLCNCTCQQSLFSSSNLTVNAGIEDLPFT